MGHSLGLADWWAGGRSAGSGPDRSPTSSLSGIDSEGKNAHSSIPFKRRHARLVPRGRFTRTADADQDTAPYACGTLMRVPGEAPSPGKLSVTPLSYITRTCASSSVPARTSQTSHPNSYPRRADTTGTCWKLWVSVPPGRNSRSSSLFFHRARQAVK